MFFILSRRGDFSAFYLLFAILAGLAKGIALLVFSLIGTLISLLKPSTLRKKMVVFTFVISLSALRTIYTTNDLTPLHLLLVLLLVIAYVAVALESIETTKTFAAGLFVFTVVSTFSSSSYVPTITISTPALIGLLVLYGVRIMAGGSRICGEKPDWSVFVGGFDVIRLRAL